MKKLCAPAKINIFLEIPGLRGDGFHNIDTVMQTVSLCDEVLLGLREGSGITLSCPAVDLPHENNLAYRAAALYLERAGMTCAVDIRIEKNIPSGAGLAGGSADGAAILRGLNDHFAAFDTETLCGIAAELGSDLPFCLVGGCMRATGRGEVLSPLPALLPDCHIVIAKGTQSTSTAEAYRAIDALEYTPKSDPVPSLLAAGDLKGICAAAFNRFEEAVPFDRVIVRTLEAHGALTARLTGSGSAVYGVFDDEEKAAFARLALEKDGYWAVVCRPTGAMA